MDVSDDPGGWKTGREREIQRKDSEKKIRRQIESERSKEKDGRDAA